MNNSEELYIEALERLASDDGKAIHRKKLCKKLALHVSSLIVVKWI